MKLWLDSKAVTSDSTSRRSPSSPPHSRARYSSRSAAPSCEAAWNSSSTRGQSSAVTPDLPRQPCLRRAPVALDRDDRDAQHLGRLGGREPAEVAELDDARLARVELRQPHERLVQRDQLGRTLLADDGHLRERHLHGPAAALGAVTVARVVEQDASHDLRGDGEEVRAVLPVHALLVDEPEVRLVDERRRLERVPRVLAPHEVARDAVQLSLDEREEAFERRPVAVAPCDEQPRDLGG